MSYMVYISGPMRGYPEFNFPAFYEAEAVVANFAPEWIVHNPARIDEEVNGFDPTGMEGTTEELRVAHFDLRRVLAQDMAVIAYDCDGIVMLEGWATSAGAKAEYALAKAVGLDIWFVLDSELHRMYHDQQLLWI